MGPKGPKGPLRTPKRVFLGIRRFYDYYHFLFWLFMVNFNPLNVIEALARKNFQWQGPQGPLETVKVGFQGYLRVF